MELPQYAITRPQNMQAADGAILLRHDRGLLSKLPPDRIAGAAFSSNFPVFLEGVAEMVVTHTTQLSAAGTYGAEYDAQGDRVGTSLTMANPALLQAGTPIEPDAAAISTGYGAALIRRFVARQAARGVVVIGGLPTHFEDVPLPGDTLAAISAIYTANGARFVTLPNLSAYPRADFYDSPDHLAQPCQDLHALAIAALLAAGLGRPVDPPAPAAVQAAGLCPAMPASATTVFASAAKQSRKPAARIASLRSQ